MPRQPKQPDKSVTIGIEPGGSRATIALVDREGRVRHRCYTKTLWGRPARATLEPYLRAVETMFAHARAEGWRVQGIGACIPGTLDLTCRRPLLIPAIPSLSQFPLCDLLEARYNVPAKLHVDVDAAVLGEYHFGAGKGFRRLLLLTVNAVVGASLVIDGQIEQGPQEYIGHICHIPISTSGPRCSCGKRGCINTLITLDAMQRMVQRALRRGEETSLLQRLSKRESFSHQLLAEEAIRGDAVAVQIYGEVSRWLGAATAKYIHMFEPNVLILGGGVLSARELLLSQVRSSIMADSKSRVCSMIEILPAHLGADAALIGAAASLFS